MYPSKRRVRALEAQDRTASFTLPTTPTLLILPVKVVERGGMYYDTSTGVISFSENGFYVLNLFVNASTSASRTMYAYAEISIDGGATWSKLYNSGRKFAINGATDGQVPLSLSANAFYGGQKIRFWYWASGSVTVKTEDLPSVPAGTVIVPACRLMYGSS